MTPNDLKAIKARVTALENMLETLLAYLPPQHLYNPTALGKEMNKLRDARDAAHAAHGEGGEE